jgi:hypothetical protein
MSLIQLVDSWNKRRQKDLIASYTNEGLRASGKWAASLEGNTTQENNTIKTVILGEQYTGALVGGRTATKKSGGGQFSLRESIAIWIRQKGIEPRDGISKDSLAFLIARKIHRDGIKVPNRYNSGQFINRVFDEKAIDELKQILTDSMAETTKQQIIEAVKK